ncbi:MAG: BlaI/MecI/CopY family transcriptional regulator [Saprospiraceae bacterium]|nr:BlaI/MecI/CopY family transcriptional regulator [Saprospiraceae bacterium]
MTSPPTKSLPTDAELEVLQLLWEHGKCSVRFINDILNQKREVGYTTTLKIMQIMNDKGLVERNTDSKIHLYTALLQETKAKKRLVNDFISNAFNGSAKELVMHALGNHKATHAELDEIKALITTLEKSGKDVDH